MNNHGSAIIVKQGLLPSNQPHSSKFRFKLHCAIGGYGQIRKVTGMSALGIFMSVLLGSGIPVSAS